MAIQTDKILNLDGTREINIDNIAIQTDVNGLLSDKADKVNNATDGNFAGLDDNGNLIDSGKKASDFEANLGNPSVDGQVLSSDTNGNRIWTSIGGGGGGMKIAVYRCGNANDLKNNNGGYVKFVDDGTVHIDNDVFEIVTSGYYGIRFKKRGIVKFSYTQDITTSGSSRFAGYVYKNSNVIASNLCKDTGNYRGAWHGVAGAEVDVNNIIRLRLNLANGTVNRLDSGKRGTYVFEFFEI